jgi:hypothetical protein
VERASRARAARAAATFLVLWAAGLPDGSAAGRETNGTRLRRAANEIGERARHPNKRWNSEIGRLDEAALRARAAEVARQIAADLTDPTLQPSQMNPAFEALKEMGPMAASISDVLVANLHAHDGGSAYTRTAYFCEVTRTMAKVAPQDPAVIRALASALSQSKGKSPDTHRNGCILEALQVAGPAAAEIAGPVLRQFAGRHGMATYPHQLGKAIESIGVERTMAAPLIARAQDRQVGIDDRAASLRTLAKGYTGLSAPDQARARDVAELLLIDKFPEVRVAAAELLGEGGPPALDALVFGLDDARYNVRAAAARSLARLGPAAAPAREKLVAMLDPFLGTGEAAAAALVAIGAAAGPDVEARLRTAPGSVRPLVEATARAIQAGSMASVRQVLKETYRERVNGGYVLVEEMGAGKGQAYEGNGRRIKARFRGGPYSPSGPGAPTVEGTLTVDNAPNAFFGALVGRRAGDRVRVLLSPETIPDPYTAVPKVGPPPTRLPVAVGAIFDVEVLRVCEPVIWTITRGGGIIGPIQFEPYCR